MEILVVLCILLVVCGLLSIRNCRRKEQTDYNEYIAERIAFDASKTLNSEE